MPVGLRTFAIALSGGALTTALPAMSRFSPRSVVLGLIVGIATAALVAISTRPITRQRFMMGWAALIGGVFVAALVAALTMPGWPPTGDYVPITPLYWGLMVGVAESVLGTFVYAIGAVIAWAFDRFRARGDPLLGAGVQDGQGPGTDDGRR